MQTTTSTLDLFPKFNDLFLTFMEQFNQEHGHPLVKLVVSEGTQHLQLLTDRLPITFSVGFSPDGITYGRVSVWYTPDECSGNPRYEVLYRCWFDETGDVFERVEEATATHNLLKYTNHFIHEVTESYMKRNTFWPTAVTVMDRADPSLQNY
jgi:hypothetical protein